MSDKNQTAKPAQNAVALSVTRRGTARFDLASLFVEDKHAEVPAPRAAQTACGVEKREVIVLGRYEQARLRRLAPAA